MGKYRLILLFLAVLLVAACGKYAAGQKVPKDSRPGNSGQDQPAVNIQDNARVNPAAPPEESGVPAVTAETGETPTVIIKTNNQVSSQEAGAVLEAVDRQLTELLNTLDRLDELTEEDLQ